MIFMSPFQLKYSMMLWGRRCADAAQPGTSGGSGAGCTSGAALHLQH